MVSVVLSLAFALLAVVLERLVLVKGNIVDGVVAAVFSMSVIRDTVVVVVLGLKVVLSVVSADVGVSD